jgi:predicted solute-binding protein
MRNQTVIRLAAKGNSQRHLGLPAALAKALLAGRIDAALIASAA